MRGNYIKKYYLEDHKLAQRARLEFYRALHSGRMIAFVGAMGTEAFGYGDWKALQERFADVALETLDNLASDAPAVARVCDLAKSEIAAFDRLIADSSLDEITGMSMIEEVLALPELRGVLPRTRPDGHGSASPWPLDSYVDVHEAMRVRLSQAYRRPPAKMHASATLEDSDFLAYDTPHALWHKLGIRRFSTPSYDFEIERCAMLGDMDRIVEVDGSRKFADPFLQLRNLRERRAAEANEAFEWDLGSGRIRRMYADGWAVESDMVNRERIDRMIEFAVGTDDVDAHIMHLHGRACNPRSIIASRRDYDALYRRNDLNRAPFEFAKKMMMGGNPILFVGLGMSEHELNREMEEFISNAPYQRAAPTFLVWNAGSKLKDAKKRRAFRLEKLARFGVLTIFDEDLGLTASGPSDDVKRRWGTARANRSAQLHDLAAVVSKLAPSERQSKRINPMLRETHIGTRWRSMAGRIASADGPITLWRTTKEPMPCNEQDLQKLARRVSRSAMLAIIGPQGCGKGTISANIAALARDDPKKLGITSKDHCLIVNGGFAFDTDTILEGVALFLQRRLDPQNKLGWRSGQQNPKISRTSFFRQLDIAKRGAGAARCLVVINGLERFCGVDGQALSAELDELLRMATPKGATPPKVRFLFFGSARIREYCNALGAQVEDFASYFSSCTSFPRDPLPDPHKTLSLPGAYLNDVWRIMVGKGIRPTDTLIRSVDRYDANGATHVSGDFADLRRELFSMVFDETNLGLLIDAKDKTEIAIARLILRALAFIGSPVEDAVLCRMPGLKPHAGRVETIRSRLCDASLVLEIDGYRGDVRASSVNSRYVPRWWRPAAGADANAKTGPKPRYALHRSLLTELRYRFGIPLNEAKLSTAFNMALYVAQPIDGDIPDREVHDELGDAIDALIGSYRSLDDGALTANDAAVGSARLHAEAIAEACGHSDPLIGKDGGQLIYSLCSAGYVQSLRGALAIIRGYYSTTGLLTLDSGDRLASIERDGILLEHAERLDALIDAYGKITLARQKMNDLVGAEFADQFGQAEPFYPDELVWMHNERGVVRLAMGDLYEARRSFDQAMLVNRKWVEADDPGHNWRRIRLNQLTVEMEMGEIGRVERYCDELERVTLHHPDGTPKGHPSIEEQRAMAIVGAHRAWVKHLQGDLAVANTGYEKALETFAVLGEDRARAFFGWLQASVRDGQPTADRMISRLTAAQQIAQSARQMDIVHRIQISLATALLLGNPRLAPDNDTRQRANRMLEEALSYGIVADVHRVRLEASMTIARARLQTADYEGALRYAMDAMMIATRYGMELRKIALRAIIAQVMVARGHPVTAERLARTCIKMATRKRFQTAIDHAEHVILDIPRVSASISRSDGSGRREF